MLLMIHFQRSGEGPATEAEPSRESSGVTQVEEKEQKQPNKTIFTCHLLLTSLDVFVFQVVLPFPVPDDERTFAIDDPDLPKLEKELNGDVALKLPPGFTVDQLK